MLMQPARAGRSGKMWRHALPFCALALASWRLAHAAADASSDWMSWRNPSEAGLQALDSWGVWGAGFSRRPPRSLHSMDLLRFRRSLNELQDVDPTGENRVARRQSPDQTLHRAHPQRY